MFRLIVKSYIFLLNAVSATAILVYISLRNDHILLTHFQGIYYDQLYFFVISFNSQLWISPRYSHSVTYKKKAKSNLERSMFTIKKSHYEMQVGSTGIL